MSRASEYIILHEDKLHLVFVQYFLKKLGVHYRLIRAIPCPKGKGSGEQHVRTRYPEELKAYRSRAVRARTVLIVVIDADSDSLEDHNRELDNSARGNGVEPRTPQENVVHLIPKRNIETWLAYLADPDSGGIDEEKSDYKQNYGFHRRESESHALIDRLFDACQNREDLQNFPPSLRSACREFRKVQSLIDG